MGGGCGPDGFDVAAKQKPHSSLSDETSIMRFPRIQFSLFGLLAAMAVFGVALACILKFGLSLPMVTILWSLLLVVLMLMPILAWLGKPERRPFYAGAAWFGWIYTLIFMFGFVTHTPISLGPHALRSSSPARFPA